MTPKPPRALPREAEPAPPVQSNEPPRVIVQDEKYLYVFYYNNVFKIDKASMKVVGTTTLH